MFVLFISEGFQLPSVGAAAGLEDKVRLELEVLHELWLECGGRSVLLSLSDVTTERLAHCPIPTRVSAAYAIRVYESGWV